MDALLTMIFLSVPLMIVLFVIVNARRFSWVSYICILVVTMMGIVVFIPLLNSMTSDTSYSGNISKTLDYIVSSDAMNNFITIVFPVILLIGAIICIMWIVGGVMKKYSSVEHAVGRREKKEKKDEPTFIGINMKKMDREKEKSKEVITSGWSNKK